MRSRSRVLAHFPVALVLLLLSATPADADPTWSTAFAPAGFDAPPVASTVHEGELALRGPFTRVSATEAHGLVTLNGSVADDLGASLEAYLAGQIIRALGSPVSWNGDLVLYCRYNSSPGIYGGESLYGWDGTEWSELPNPPYALDSNPNVLTVWDGKLLVGAFFDGEPTGANLASLDPQGNWTYLTAPLPDVTIDPGAELWGERRSAAVTILDGEIHSYSVTTIAYLDAPIQFENHWRVDRFDGSAWQPVTSGLEYTHGTTMGGGSGTVWGMSLHAVGSSLFRYTSTGYSDAPTHEFQQYLGANSWSADLSPAGATAINGIRTVPGGVVAWGTADDGGWVGFFDGSAWTMYGQQIQGNVNTVSELGGTVYAFGDFLSVDGQLVADAAMYEAGSWSPLFTPSMAPLAPVLSIAEFDGDVWASTDAGGLPGTAASVAAWDGTAWAAGANPVPGAPRVFSLYPWNGQLLAGSDIGLCANNGFSQTCDNGIAGLQSGSWQALGWIVKNTYCYDVFDCDVFPTYVYDFVEHDGELYASGNFLLDQVGGDLPAGVGKWSPADPGQWVHPGAGLPALNREASFFLGEPYVYSLESWQGQLLIGGDFEWWAQDIVSLVGYDGSQTIALGTSLFAAFDSSIQLPSVHDMLVMPDGLYVGGNLRPQTPSDPLAAIAFQPNAEFPDGAWSALGSGIDGTVHTMIEFEGGVLVGGEFSQAGGLACNSLALWDGTQWSVPFDGVTQLGGAPGSVNALALVGPDLHIGGDFEMAGDVPSANYAILELASVVANEPASPRSRTALLGVFPNPFNPSTEIRFSLNRGAGSRLDLYDTVGRRVRSFDLSGFDEGPGSVRWDGTDAQGRRVATGVYFARLESGGAVDGTRLVLLK